MNNPGFWVIQQLQCIATPETAYFVTLLDDVILLSQIQTQRDVKTTAVLLSILY